MFSYDFVSFLLRSSSNSGIFLEAIYSFLLFRHVIPVYYLFLAFISFRFFLCCLIIQGEFCEAYAWSQICVCLRGSRLVVKSFYVVVVVGFIPFSSLASSFVSIPQFHCHFSNQQLIQTDPRPTTTAYSNARFLPQVSDSLLFAGKTTAMGRAGFLLLVATTLSCLGKTRFIGEEREEGI